MPGHGRSLTSDATLRKLLIRFNLLYCLTCLPRLRSCITSSFKMHSWKSMICRRSFACATLRSNEWYSYLSLPLSCTCSLSCSRTLPCQCLWRLAEHKALNRPRDCSQSSGQSVTSRCCLTIAMALTTRFGTNLERLLTIEIWKQVPTAIIYHVCVIACVPWVIECALCVITYTSFITMYTHECDCRQ